MGLLDSHPNTWLPIGTHGGRLSEDFVHEEIHEGHVFRGGIYETLGAASAVSILVVTGKMFIGNIP